MNKILFNATKSPLHQSKVVKHEIDRLQVYIFFSRKKNLIIDYYSYEIVIYIKDVILCIYIYNYMLFIVM
jgi:hypothetical protein